LTANERLRWRRERRRRRRRRRRMTWRTDGRKRYRLGGGGEGETLENKLINREGDYQTFPRYSVSAYIHKQKHI